MKRKWRILALLIAVLLASSALCASAEPLAFEADTAEEAEQNPPEEVAVEIIEDQPEEAAAPEEEAATLEEDPVPEEPAETDFLPENTPEPQGAEEENEEVSVSESEELLVEDAEVSWPVALSEIGYVDALTIGVKEAVTPEVSYVPASADDVLTYSSSNARIAKVDAGGKITGVRKGVAVITVQSAAGASASCNVTVSPAPKKASFAQSKGALGVGQAQRLELALNNGAASHQISWNSSNAGVATVENGLVTAVSPGTAKITATTYNRKKASYTLTVKPAATAMRAAEAVKLCVGQLPYAPQVTLEPADALSDIGFASGDESIVAVKDGKLVARRTGGTNITVTARNGEHTTSAKIAVTVVEAPTGIEIANPVEALGMKESYTFRANLAGDQDLGAHNVWSSDKPNVLQVVDAAKGEFKALKKGAANVAVTSANGLTASAAVKVQSAPSKLTLSTKKGTLGLNETVQLTAKLPKNAASQITWESSNTAVATVENGLVTAVAPGPAKITAQTFNKKKANYSITVAAAPESIDVPPSLALGVGQKYTLDVALAPANSAGKLIVANSNEAAVQLDKGELPAANSASLKLTALAPGSATLHFESYNGLSATCEVSVYSAPTSLRITNAVTLGKGETYQLLAENDSNEALLAHCKWKSSNKKVLQVGGSGKLTAKKTGTAKITVTLPKGNKTLSSKSVKIRVVAAPSGVTLDSASADLRIGGELQLTATLSPANSASQISWTSSNEAVAQVDGSGKITAVGGGEATITAQTFNDLSADCAVTVASPEAPEITINGEPAGGEIPEVSDSVTLGWSSPVPAQSYDVEVAGEDGAAILDLQSTSETNAIIEKEQMVSDAIYTVRVTATYNLNGVSSTASWRARFKYIDPNAVQGGSTLVAYFSATGTTKKLAKYAADILGADLYEIVPEKPYTKADLAYNTDCRANREQADPTSRPAIAGSVENMEAYDTILLGYPIWHGQAPRIISTFLESYDFSGKTILPFCTSHSSGIGSSDTNLHALADRANWLSGKRFPTGTSWKEIESWLNQAL